MSPLWKKKICLIKWAPYPSNIWTLVGKEEEILVACKCSRLIGKRRIARRYVSHIARNGIMKLHWFQAEVKYWCKTKGSFGLSLFLLKLKTETENWNWKHCSKIIFKCVNSAVGLIFNEKIAEKWNLWVREQCTNALFTVEKRRREKSAGQKRKRNNQLNPNTHKERYRVLCLVAKMKHFFLSWKLQVLLLLLLFCC